MKLSASDASVSAVVLLLASLLIWLYLQDTGRNTVLNDETPLGTIEFRKQRATRRVSGGLVWERMRNNTPVYEADTLRTAEASEAVVRFDDGTALDMLENSMLRLDFEGDERTFEFLGGEISVSGHGGSGGAVAPGDAGQGAKTSGGYSIRAGDRTITVAEGSNASLVRTGEKLSVEVLEGEVSLVHADGRSETVDRAKELEVNLETGTSRVVSRQVFPLKPEQNARFLIEHPGTAGLDFSWSIEGDADSTCILEISDTAGFDSVMKSVPSADGTLSVDIAPGSWYWRVRSPDGSVSSSRRFTLYSDAPPRQILPAQGAETAYRKILPDVRFSWTGTQHATACIFEIASDPEFSNPLKKVRTTVNGITVGSLGVGTWYWRVTPVYPMTLPAEKTEPEVRSLVIKSRGDMAALTPTMPLKDSLFLLEETAGKGMNFSWTPDPEAVEYELSLSGSIGMGNPEVTKTTDRPWLALPGSEAAAYCRTGVWYWAVRWKDAEGNVSPYSEPVPLHGIDAAAAVKLTFPPDGYAVADSLIASTRFAWKSGLPAVTVFQLSTDPSFSTVVWEERSDMGTLIGKKWMTGTWYWRIKTLNTDGSVFVETQARMFRVVDPLPEPGLLTPVPGNTLHLRKEDSYTFSWEEVKGADYYRFGLYAVPDGEPEKLIHATDFIQDTKIELPFGAYPDGLYRIRLQAFGLDKETSTRIIGYLGRPSFAFRIISRMALSYPPDGTEFEGLDARRYGVDLSWRVPDIPENSVLIVSGDPEGKTVLFREPGGPGGLHIERLGAGEYYWTVKGDLYGYDVSAQQLHRFVVHAIPPLPSPANLAPRQGFVFGPDQLRSSPLLRFSWNPVPGATRYVFSLFRGADTFPMLHTDSLTRPEQTVSDLSVLDRGAYRWTVKAQGFDRNGELEQDGITAESSFRIELPRIGTPRPGEKEFFYGR